MNAARPTSSTRSASSPTLRVSAIPGRKQALGLGHAIYQAKDYVGGEPFAVVLADDIVDAEVPALKQMIDVYEKYDAPVIATMRVAGEAISRFVRDRPPKRSSPASSRSEIWSRKPPVAEAPSDLAIIGRYIFTPDIFDAIEQTTEGAGGEIQITDAMRILLKKRPFYAVKLDGVRHGRRRQARLFDSKCRICTETRRPWT